jgi:membrane-associated protease RseP (regulator of RpoE activity)
MAVILAMSVQQPVSAAILLCSYFGIIFLHEAGHAYFAKRLGYRSFDVYLGAFHGLCRYEAPRSKKDESIIAWGGVAAQIAIAMPLIVVAHFTSISEVPGFGPVVVFLGYFSAMIAIINLAPTPALDGGKAWSLIPILLAERRRPKSKSNVTKGPWPPK